MIINTYINELNYTYNAEHKGSHYLIENKTTYCNKGEFSESVCKYKHGCYEAHNPTTAWNKGSDIEHMQASVKSSEASLGRGITGDTIEEMAESFFKETPSTLFIWINIDELTQQVTEYHMNKAEFKMFIMNFTRVHHSSSKKENIVRFRKHTKKMEQWFEELATAC